MGRDQEDRGPSGRCRRSAGPRRRPYIRVANESSPRTRSAASLATPVPDPMATATSARCRAGASLTPSPVTATVRPAARATRTSRSFCSGVDRATTWSRPSSAVRRASSQPARSSPTDDAIGVEPGLGGDRRGRQRMVAGHDDDLDPGDHVPSRAPRGSHRASGRRSRSSARTVQAPRVGTPRDGHQPLTRGGPRLDEGTPTPRARRGAARPGSRIASGRADRGLLDRPAGAVAARLRRPRPRPTVRDGVGLEEGRRIELGSPPASITARTSDAVNDPGADPSTRTQASSSARRAVVRRSSLAGPSTDPARSDDRHDVEPVPASASRSCR